MLNLFDPIFKFMPTVSSPNMAKLTSLQGYWAMHKFLSSNYYLAFPSVMFLIGALVGFNFLLISISANTIELFGRDEGYSWFEQGAFEDYR